MHKLRLALSLFPYTPVRHWPGLTFYFVGWFLYRLCGIRLFRERQLRLKPFTVCADIEGQSGLAFLHEILVQNIYDFPEPAEAKKIRLFHDLGANCGFFTLTRCAGHPGLRGVSFEPHPVTFGRLQHNLAANNLSERVKAEHAAVAASSGECELNVSPDSSMGVVSTSSAQCLDKSNIVRVRSWSLDDYAREHNSYPDLLKIDVEGFEVEVLKGAGACLTRAGYVILEFHSEQLKQDCLAILHAAGFKTTLREGLIFARK